MSRRILFALILSFVALLVAAQRPEPAAPRNGQSPPNVLLVTVDTLRADHVSSYGYLRKTTPNMDRLAADGVRFERAYSNIPLTGPSHISLLTSRYPQEHGARINGIAYRKRAAMLFLPQILHGHGYKTAAFVSAWPLTSRLTHLDEYFDLYDEDLPRSYQMFNSMRFAEDVNPRAIDWLKSNADGPFFLWVHYFDPHTPYQNRPEYRDLEQTGEPNYPGLDMKDRATRERILEYDAEVAYTDHYLGQLLDVVDELGLRDSTMVVVAADHGESLGEHGYIGHGRQLYEATVRVPLMFRFPGVIEAGKVVTEAVSLLDLTPTVIDIALKRSEPDLDLPFDLSGRSIMAALRGGTIEEETVRSLTFGGKKGFFPRWLSFLWTDVNTDPLLLARTSGNRKVIWDLGDNEIEIYDTLEDPYELSPSRPNERTQQFKLETARLDRWYKATEGEAGENKMTEDDLKALESLGYLQ